MTANSIFRSYLTRAIIVWISHFQEITQIILFGALFRTIVRMTFSFHLSSFSYCIIHIVEMGSIGGQNAYFYRSRARVLSHRHTHTRTLRMLGLALLATLLHPSTFKYIIRLLLFFSLQFYLIYGNVLTIRCQKSNVKNENNKKLVFYGHFIFLQYIQKYRMRYANVRFIFLLLLAFENYKKKKATIN